MAALNSLRRLVVSVSKYNKPKSLHLKSSRYNSFTYYPRISRKTKNNPLYRLNNAYLSSASTDSLPIIITDACTNRMNELKKKRDENELMLRVAISAGGCSGFQYEFEFSDNDDIEEDDDIILTKNDAKFIVDKTSMRFLKGAKLDFVSDFIQTSFVVIDNPNIVSECGCNVSFAPNPELLDGDDDDDDNVNEDSNK